MKDTIKSILSKNTTPPFLFIGSGLSRRYLNLEDWKGLLKRFTEQTGQNYTYLSSGANGDLPVIASNLAERYYDFWWNDASCENSRIVNEQMCTTRKSPLKIEISNYLKSIKEKHTNDPNYLKEIELLKEAKISGIITTNWDQFLENIFKDFNVYIGQDDLFLSEVQGVAEIYKIHGCCSKPNSLILTDEDYKDFRERSTYLAAKLMTIFTEYPIIFLGYSLNDENIIEILKSITFCFRDVTKLERLQDRLIFIKRCKNGESERVEKSFIAIGSSQIPVTVIYLNDFLSLFQALKDLKIGHSAKLLRLFKEKVYEYVYSKNIKEKVYVMDIEDVEDRENIEIVMGVGAISRIKETGYRGVTKNEIYWDVIFDDKEYNSYHIIEQSFDTTLVKKGGYCPIFKYLCKVEYISDTGTLLFRTPIKLSETKWEDRRIPERLISFFDEVVKQGISYFHPSQTYMKDQNKIEKMNLSLKEYAEQNGNYNLLKYYSFFPEKERTSEKLLDFIKLNYDSCFNSDNGFIKSEFNKMICLYDYTKNYLKK